MHDDSRLVLQRVDRFINERIAPAVHPTRFPAVITAWEVPDEPVPFGEAVLQRFEAFSEGAPWSKPWGTAWFHVEADLPPEWLAMPGHSVEVIVDLGFSGGAPGFQAEGLVYRPDGTVVKAIEPFNMTVPVAEARVDLYVEAASNPDIGGSLAVTPLGSKTTAGSTPIYVLRRIDIALRDVTVWELERDLWTIRGLHAELSPDSTRAAQLLRAMERMCDDMDPFDVAGTAERGRAALAGVLADEASLNTHRVTAVGHAHIDSAWLWPTRETIRKCARTFSNVLALMDEDPGFVFACSSAQQYAWVKQFYPELFERIRARVIEGRFVPVGGMWVESDTNMVGGEAMVRQFLAGQAFFMREFGRRSVTGWLPDSFGYSAALPQIMAGAGLEQFVTQKISWNDTNRFPHHTFLWEGLDGTRIYSHFPPMDTYNSVLSPAELARQERQYSEKGAANSSLALFGYGDGGGGPTREMMAAARRAASLDGSPRVAVDTPEQFFQHAKSEYAHPPVWSGELYLELHRGTYTSQHRTKQGNRRSEHLLREAELWATTAAVRTGTAYPYATLARAWETVLLQQFHDILPGSSIAWVYEDAERNYAEVADVLEEVIRESLAALGGDGTGFLLNAAPVELRGVPPLGSAPSPVPLPAAVRREGERLVLENGLVRFVFDAEGSIVSAVDRSLDREAIAPGESIGLDLFRDTPNLWDAWDIDPHYRRHGRHLRAASIDADVDSGTVTMQYAFGRSTIRQRFVLDDASPTLEIVTEVDWREREQLLKMSFPLDVRAKQSAAETQFGHVYRSTHENTSWDVARFEICAHRWVHVAEPGFGIAIANDSTYGHDVTAFPQRGGGTGTLVRQSLLRAPMYPDPEADQGQHTLRASMTLGADIPDAISAGYALNLPMREAGAFIEPLVQVQGDGALIESVKLAEDGSGDVIVRIYEPHGRRSEVGLELRFDGSGPVQTDLLESEIAADGLWIDPSGRMRLKLRPFQLVTLRIPRGRIECRGASALRSDSTTGTASTGETGGPQ